MLNVVLREFTRCLWISGCRELIQERGNGGIGGRKPRRCKRFKGEILKNLAVLGVDQEVKLCQEVCSQDWLVQVSEEELESAGTKL